MKITFSYLVTTFFTAHLGAELGLSPNTVASYSDCMKLLVNYLCEQLDVDLPRNGDLVVAEDIDGNGRADLIMRYNLSDGPESPSTVRLLLALD